MTGTPRWSARNSTSSRSVADKPSSDRTSSAVRSASALNPRRNITLLEFLRKLKGRLDEFDTDPAVFQAGVVRAVERIIEANAGRKVAVVCHGGVINAYLGHMLEIDRLLWVELDYAAICRVAVSRNGVRSVLALNERPHACGLSSSESVLTAPFIAPLPGGSS